MASRYYFRELLESNLPLLRHVIDFNRDRTAPASDVPIFRAAMRNRELNAAWEKQLGQPQPQASYWEFTEESRRLALLPATELRKLALIAAASLTSDLIVHTVTRDDVLALRDYFGQDLIDYATTRGRFQAGTLLAAVADFRPAGVPPVLAAQYTAWLVLAVIRNEWPEELKTRTSALWAEVNLPTAGDATEAKSLAAPLWHFLKKLISRELDAKWKPYFD